MHTLNKTDGARVTASGGDLLLEGAVDGGTSERITMSPKLVKAVLFLLIKEPSIILRMRLRVGIRRYGVIAIHHGSFRGLISGVFKSTVGTPGNGEISITVTQ